MFDTILIGMLYPPLLQAKFKLDCVSMSFRYVHRDVSCQVDGVQKDTDVYFNPLENSEKKLWQNFHTSSWFKNVCVCVCRPTTFKIDIVLMIVAFDIIWIRGNNIEMIEQIRQRYKLKKKKTERA